MTLEPPATPPLEDRSSTVPPAELQQAEQQQAVPAPAAVPETSLARWSRWARLAALVALIVLLGISQGLSMLIVVAAIVIMIFLHELGHYVMAKRAGMLVTEFFLGFGPRIWSFHRGETEYGIKAIPAGAYVKVIGMSNMEEVDPSLEHRTYRQKSFRQRLGVAVAGSAMHFLLAFVLLYVQFVAIGDPTTERWAVGQITTGSAADAAGVQEGDEILTFDGREVPSFDEFRLAIADADAGTVEMVVLRSGEELVVPVELSERTKLIGTIGEDIDVVDNGERLLVGEPLPDGVAEAAGLEAGATLRTVEGVAVTDLDQVVEAAAGADDGALVLGIVGSDGAERTVEVDLGTDLAATPPAAFVGVGSSRILEPTGPIAAFTGSVSSFWEGIKLSVGGVAQFIWPPNLIGFVVDAVTGVDDPNATDTPTQASQTPLPESDNRPISIVGVAKIGSDLTAENLSSLVMFLATINIFIGVFNLFPMLPFDGGHVVIACYEKFQELRRRSRERYLSDVSRLLPFAYGIVAVLAVVGVLAIYLDITRPISL